MALSLMIYNKGSKIFSYKEMFRRIISYLIRHKKIIKRSHQNERPTSQNTKMALWPHDDDLQIFFSKFLTTHDVIWRKYLLDIAMQLVNYGLEMISSISDTYLDG